VNGFIDFFKQFAKFEPMFSLCKFVRVSNGCCMMHSQPLQGTQM